MSILCVLPLGQVISGTVDQRQQILMGCQISRFLPERKEHNERKSAFQDPLYYSFQVRFLPLKQQLILWPCPEHGEYLPQLMAVWNDDAATLFGHPMASYFRANQHGAG